MTPVLRTKYAFTITANIGGVTSAGDVGHGVRRIIPITGGEVRGADINGKVCAFGADFQIIRPNELIELEAKYAFETGAAKYRWLMEHLFIGSAARHADRVVIDVHQVL
jgi:hypothetical protein